MKDPQYKQLARWVERQRAAYRDGMMFQDRFKKLDQLGFVFPGKRTPKDLNNKKQIEAEPQVAKVEIIELPEAKVNPKHIDSTSHFQDVVLSPSEQVWYNRYQELARFKNLYGHCYLTKKHRGWSIAV